MLKRFKSFITQVVLIKAVLLLVTKIMLLLAYQEVSLRLSLRVNFQSVVYQFK